MSLHLTIDGRPCTAQPKQTVLDAAKAAGVEIPTLCHDPRLPPNGACLLCVVEVEGAPRLQLSCATEAREGMVVTTRSPRVDAARRVTLELLLSNHHADCRGECYARCPASVDVQGYLALAHAGRWAEAVALVREKNPLPSVCGRICVRYCEATCRRKDHDEAVGINLVKRFVTDEAGPAPAPIVAPSRGRSVAIVGGGPAGLTAAYFLARRGYRVQIREAQPKLGGTLRYGIPDYRLPQDVLDRDVQHVLDHGVEVRTGVRLGRDFTLDTLREDGFEAVLLALGAMRAKPMGVPGEDTPGVLGGVDFLAQVKLQGPPQLKGTVLVVGGGNTAIDAARTALRCGASRSVLVYRRTREEMPADPGEVEDALAEGVQIEFLQAPLEVVCDDGHLRALRCQRMKLGDPDASGRRKPVPVEGAVQDLPCNTLIAAIGQDVDLGGTRGAAAGDLAASKWKTLQADPLTFATNLRGVFAAGDVVSGPAAVVDAIGAARRAAQVIDGYLTTGLLEAPRAEFLSKRTNLGEPTPDWFTGVGHTPRAEPRKTLPEERVGTWLEMDHGLDRGQALAESGRCLSCGCSAVFTCLLKRYADEYGVEQPRFRGKVKKYKLDARHPFISFDPNKCILCGKCVRLCADLVRVPALGFVHRGFETMMRPSMERALQDTTCVSCGNCLEACPTGAIHARLPAEQPGPFRLATRETVCSYCGVGCGVVVNRSDDRFWHATSRPTPAGTESLLCVRGRFGHRYTCDTPRLAVPREGRGPQQWPTELGRALGLAAAGLRRVAEAHGPGALAFLASPRATNEELHLLQALARETFGTNNVASAAALELSREPRPLHPMLGATTSTLPLVQVEGADVIVLVNADPAEDNPVLGFHLNRAVRRGAELWSLSAMETRTSALSTRRLDARRGTSGVLLHALVGEVDRRGGADEEFLAARTTGVDALRAGLPADLADAERVCGVGRADLNKLAARLADRAAKVVFVYDLDSVTDSAAGDLQQVANLLLLTGRLGTPRGGLVLARRQSNAQGADDLGLLPEARAGLPGAASLADLRRDLLDGRIRGLLVWGEDPAADAGWGRALVGAEFVVAADLFETETTRGADLVLPWSALSESEGSVTSMDRRVQAVAPAFAAPAGLTGFDLLTRLGVVLGRPPASLLEVRQQIAAQAPGYGPLATLAPGASFRWGADRLFEDRFATPDGRAAFAKAVPVAAPGVRSPQPLSSVEAYFSRLYQRAFPRAAAPR